MMRTTAPFPCPRHNGRALPTQAATAARVDACGRPTIARGSEMRPSLPRTAEAWGRSHSFIAPANDTAVAEWLRLTSEVTAAGHAPARLIPLAAALLRWKYPIWAAVHISYKRASPPVSGSRLRSKSARLAPLCRTGA